MSSYYEEKLSGRRLQRCYELASPRIQRYLEAEIRHVLDRLRALDTVLELGCGYGRVSRRLAQVARRVVGIDTSQESLAMARQALPAGSPCWFVRMNAVELAFSDEQFEAVVCVQNGVCAFRVRQEDLYSEALRVLRPGGRLLVSTYADRFWPDRLAWFEAQAAEGLLGPVDHRASGEGTIVCADGFRSGRLTPEALRELGSRIGVEPEITEVDGSSVFSEVVRPETS